MRPVYDMMGGGTIERSVPLTSDQPQSQVMALATPQEVRWRWMHLIAFGLLAFVLPQIATITLAPRERLSQFLDASLYFQIIAYFFAALLLVYLVRNTQNGDWSTVGITRDKRPLAQLLWGAAFGLLLVAAVLGISFAINGGDLKVDALVKALVGSTSGIGLVLAAVVVVFGAPLIEEVFFRGMLFEKLARWKMWAALVVTTILFYLAHGRLFLLPILVLGAALGWKRRRHGLWYTIGAHGAWNLVVLALAAFMFLGSWTFSPSDASYSVVFPKSWERTDELPPAPQGPGFSFDLGATTSGGSMLLVMRTPIIDGSARPTLEKIIDEADGVGMAAVPRTEIEGHDHLFDEGAESFSVTYGITRGTTEVASHIVVFVVPYAHQAVVFNFVCERRVCEDEFRRFDELLHEVDFAPAAV